jgi:GT2 family glycosyltransferase
MSHSVVTVIVINWNLKEETLQCLHSLEQLTIPCRTIVVDNGSIDDSVKAFRQYIPQMEVIKLPSNMGFATACNRAIEHALMQSSCEFVLLLNNDAIIHPHAIQELLEVAQSHPSAGIFGPKVYTSGGTNKIWYAGARRRRMVLAAKGTGRGMIDRGQFSELREVDYVFGAAMLIRSNVFKRIGLFDERFFLYLEDLDFCLRAQKAGFSLLFVPQAHVYHKGSASTANITGFRTYHTVRSTILFLKKHTSWHLSLPVLLFWTSVAMQAMLVDMLRGNLAALRFYWMGLIRGLAEARK